MPKRIQRKRVKGWKKPPNTVYVGRGSSWGNPFFVGRDGTAEECVRKYICEFMPYTHREPTNALDEFFRSVLFLESAISELRGKDLMCWCRTDKPCHGDFLLNIANMENYSDKP